MESIPDFSDFQSLLGSSTGSLSCQPLLHSHIVDNAAISNQTIVYPRDPWVITSSHSNSLYSSAKVQKVGKGLPRQRWPLPRQSYDYTGRGSTYTRAYKASTTLPPFETFADVVYHPWWTQARNLNWLYNGLRMHDLDWALVLDLQVPSLEKVCYAPGHLAHIFFLFLTTIYLYNHLTTSHMTAYLYNRAILLGTSLFPLFVCSPLFSSYGSLWPPLFVMPLFCDAYCSVTLLFFSFVCLVR